MVFEEIYRGYLLLDSSALIALIDEHDQNHDYSIVALNELRNDADIRLFICNLTIYETYTRLRYRFNWEKATEIWRTVAESLQPAHLEFRSSYERKTRQILEMYRAYALSFHDAGCAALMLDRRIGRVFTFDNDFSVIGFERYPAI